METEKLCVELADVFQVDAEQLLNGTFEINESSMDSLAVLSIIAIVDEKFGVMLDPEKLVASKSINDIYLLIESGKK